MQKSASTTGIGLDYFSDKADFDTRAITSCAAQVDKGNEDDEDEEQQQEKQQQASANSESDSPAAINNLVLTGANGGFQEVSERSPKSVDPDRDYYDMVVVRSQRLGSHFS